MSEMKEKPKDRSRPELRAAFAKRYGVKQYRFREESLARFILSGRGDREAIRTLVEMARDHQLHGGAFDHPELWGRDRKVLHLIGQPYQVGTDALGVLSLFRESGFYVCISSPSWYGYGTIKVHVFDLDSPPKPREVA